MIAEFLDWLFQTYPNAAPLMFLVVGISFISAGVSAFLPPPGKGPAFTKLPFYPLLYRVINFVAINLKWARNYGDPKIEKYDPFKGDAAGIMHKLASMQTTGSSTPAPSPPPTSSGDADHSPKS